MSEVHSQPEKRASASLRLAFLTELYYPHVGGQEVFFQELGEAMVRRGHSVDVYCITHDAALPPSEMVNGVHVHRSQGSGVYPRPVIRALRRNWSDIVRYSAGVRRLDPGTARLLSVEPMAVVARPRVAQASTGAQRHSLV